MKYSFTTFDTCPCCTEKELKLLGKRLNTSQGFKPHKKAGISTSIMKAEV